MRVTLRAAFSFSPSVLWVLPLKRNCDFRLNKHSRWVWDKIIIIIIHIQREETLPSKNISRRRINSEEIQADLSSEALFSPSPHPLFSNFFFFSYNRIFHSVCLSSAMTVNKGNCVRSPAYTTALQRTHKSTLCERECVYSGWLCFSFASPRPLQQTQHSHWRKIRAKPHLGTLPLLKQIRPQRLIKKKNSGVQSSASTDEGVPKRGDVLGYLAPSKTNRDARLRCLRRRRRFDVTPALNLPRSRGKRAKPVENKQLLVQVTKWEWAFHL